MSNSYFKNFKEGYFSSFKSTPEHINTVETLLSLKLPKLYKEIVLIGDDLSPNKNNFFYKNPYSRIKSSSSIGGFIALNFERNDNIVKYYFTLPSFFPKMVVPFAEVGDGDLICFDYSVSGFDDHDPPIVYYLHENEEGKNIADIAINFEEFLSLLKSEGEIEEELKRLKDSQT